LNPKYLTLIIAAALSAVSASAGASGYRFGSQSVSAQGTADANGAEAADASTIFANPAGLSRLDGMQIMGGITAVVPDSSYTDGGSKHFTGAPTGGVTSQDDYTPRAVAAPSLYFSKKINDQFSAGFGMFVPYGTKLSYDWNWSGRYALTNVELKSITLNPSFSFKLNEQHSFGFGIDAEAMKAKLGQAVDVPGTIQFLKSPAGAAAGGNVIKAIMAAGGNPAALATAKDAHGSNDGKDWGFGFNLGYLYNVNADTRVGLAYRSSIKHELKGSTVWDFSTVTADPIVNKILQASGRKENSAALVELRTPETISANVFSQIDSNLALMADVTWSRHSRMQNLVIQFPGTTEGDETIRQEWKDTVRWSAGLNYKYSDNLTVRAGLALDESPVKNDTLRHPALPDADRTQISLGLNYKLSPKSSIDLAYSYLKFADAGANYTNACNPLATTCTGNGETTVGTWKTNLQLIGVAYSYKF
jgi:long-chain fatty acid transport protein